MKKLFLFLSIIIFLFACEKEKKTQDVFTPQKQEAEKVDVLTINKRLFYSKNSYPGVLKESDSFQIASEVGGVIEYMPYDVSDFVKKGSVVVKVNTESLQAQLKQLEVNLKNSVTNYNRISKLFEKGLATQAQIDQAEYAKESVEASISALKVNLRKSITTSPFNGYVVQRGKQKGEIASPGLPIVSLMQLDPIRFVVSVPERDIYKINKGNIVKVTIEASQKELNGVVYRISQTSNKSNHTVPVEIELENPKNGEEYLLKPGMFASLTIPIVREANGWVIPLDSIIRTESEKYVFVVRDNKSIKINITIKATYENEALVDAEFKNDENIVISGQNILVDGRGVVINKTSSMDSQKYLYKKSIARCKKAEEDILTLSKEILNSDLTVFDFFKSESGYILLYDGLLNENLKSCLSEI
ncbi:efflux RND transporter periplasmic adaptor subunit [bacterium]|nr:efflux RND transporter periplasmic adaptor subunit [bacterium]